MEKYSVRVVITALFDVKAESPDDAIVKANEYVSNYDFRRLRDIDWGVEKVTDESGNRVD